MNLLFTCVGRRNYLINYFRQALKGEGSIWAVDNQITAPALAEADKAIQMPLVYDDVYIPTLLNIVKQNAIDAIIPLNDLELPILSAAKGAIEHLGARVVVSDQVIIDQTFDKWETVKLLKKAGLKSPDTYIDLAEAKKAINAGALNFPLVIKPRWGSGSIGVSFVENIEELELTYKLLLMKLNRTILATVSKNDMENAILIQEKIDGVEYGMDVLNDFNGNYIGTFARKKLAMRSGVTDKAVSVVNQDLLTIGKTIGEHLKHIGNLDCDVFERNGEYLVLEMNPRFGGGYPFSHQAGVNTPAIYLEWMKGNNDIEKYIDYKPGIMHAKCDRLVYIE